jgi:hypothetical protein
MELNRRTMEFLGTIREACSGSLGESAATVSPKGDSSNGIPVGSGATTQNRRLRPLVDCGGPSRLGYESPTTTGHYHGST